MQHRIFPLCVIVALTGLAAWAASIDGKWTADVQGRTGPQTQTLTIKSDGAKLTGTLDTGRGGAVNITEGKIDGMEVSFKAARAGKNGTSTTAYAGKLMGDDLKLTATREGASGAKGGGPQELNFKRAK